MDCPPSVGKSRPRRTHDRMEVRPMLRTLLAAFLLLGAIARPVMAQAGKATGPTREMGHDPDYAPREGDRVPLIADAPPGFSKASLFDDYFRFSEADDQGGIQTMIDKGQLVDLEGNVPVLVIRNLDPADSREPD